MNWKIKHQEYEAVMRLSDAERYTYAVKRIAAWGRVWSVGNDQGWGLARDADGNDVVPVWPHHDFAKACCSDLWAAYRPMDIEVHDFLERWVPGMERDRRLVAVFQTQKSHGVVVTPASFRDAIQADLSLYE